MHILPTRSFIIPRPAVPPIVCIKNVAIEVPDDVAQECLADGRAVSASEAQPIPPRRKREKAVIR